jgi:glycosyltransferase involved in cell wall biosynthesis
MQTYVVIPAHNEEATIKEVISEVKQYTNNIIVIDDGSTDNTSQIAEQEEIILLKHSVNLGKGAALKTGCDYAVMQGADNIIVLDSDGQHESKEIPRFLEALKNHNIVFSYRERPKNMPFVLKFGNSVINSIIKYLYGISIKDTQCGYRAFTADAYKKVRWNAQDYFMETEMIINTGKAKLKYREIPIQTIYNDKFKGTTVKDGVSIVMKMIGWRLIK